MEIDPKNPKEDNKTKKKKKDIKVIYIANPVKVKASATEFRALVQELTGRESDPSKYTAIEDIKSYQMEEPREAINEFRASSSSMEEEAKGNGNIEGSWDETSIDMIENYAVFSPPLMLCDPGEYGMSGFHKD